MALRHALAASAMIAAPVAAQDSAVTSPAATAVSVTVYRAPDRAADQPMQTGWLGGYALITEEREVEIPKGPATLRFEGVAAGMLPESAIVSGLPTGVREKNLDAALLSPRNLYARAFGRPVVLRRTTPDGKITREEPAILRSTPDGAAILQTRAGYEIASCGGLSDALAYDGVPPGLPARPTLSVATDAQVASRARLRLSYLAWGFDWQANYVLRLRAAGDAADLTAWVTLASSDSTSFAGAQAAVVGGKPHFTEAREGAAAAEELVFHCSIWPVRALPPAMAIAPPMPAPMMAMAADIMVTARKAMAPMVVQQEALGDLKLYRVPEPTTVAAHGQKQVVLLDARRVKLALIHTADITGGDDAHARITVRLRNRKADGLGLALPAGRVSVVQPMGAAAIPVGEGHIDDKAEGEEMTIDMADSPQVHVVSTRKNVANGVAAITVTVSNANRWPVRFEGRLQVADGVRVAAASALVPRKDGQPLWAVTVPAQGQARLTYRLYEVRVR